MNKFTNLVDALGVLEALQAVVGGRVLPLCRSELGDEAVHSLRHNLTGFSMVVA